MDLRDLSPQKDPKGGSPKTPYPGISPRDLPPPQPEYIYASHNGSAMLWRAIATGLGGLLAGMTVAWFTALQAHGLNQREVEEIIRESQIEQEKHLLSRAEMQTYVKEYSPWSFDKQALTSRIASQDQQIGELRTKIDLAADVIKRQSAGVKP